MHSFIQYPTLACTYFPCWTLLQFFDMNHLSCNARCKRHPDNKCLHISFLLSCYSVFLPSPTSSPTFSSEAYSELISEPSHRLTPQLRNFWPPSSHHGCTLPRSLHHNTARRPPSRPLHLQHISARNRLHNQAHPLRRHNDKRRYATHCRS